MADKKKRPGGRPAVLGVGKAAPRIPLAVPVDLLAKIDADAERLGVSRNDIMRTILEKHYDRTPEERAADVLDYAARQGVSVAELVRFAGEVDN